MMRQTAVHLVEGGHFFHLGDEADALLQTISKVLRGDS